MSAFEVLVIILWGLIGTVIEAALADSYGVTTISTPWVLYENTKMNWFGCWVCYILIRIFSPIITVIGSILLIICAILTFIEWLFTAGRKDEE